VRQGSIGPSGRGTRNEHGSLGEWDLVGLGPTDVVLVQVKTRDWPGTRERAVLADFPVPPMTRKICHRWRDRQRFPDVQML
jgi:hypothetical protein